MVKDTEKLIISALVYTSADQENSIEWSQKHLKW